MNWEHDTRPHSRADRSAERAIAALLATAPRTGHDTNGGAFEQALTLAYTGIRPACRAMGAVAVPGRFDKQTGHGGCACTA